MFVEGSEGAEGGRISGGREDGGHLGTEGVVEGDADVVDCGFWGGGVVGGVYADCVGELERGEGREVGED